MTITITGLVSGYARQHILSESPIPEIGMLGKLNNMSKEMIFHSTDNAVGCPMLNYSAYWLFVG